MIKVLFPPGMYGNYVGWCIYNYSSLRDGEFMPLEFGAEGSSHAHRSNANALSKVRPIHIDSIPGVTEDDIVIRMIPERLSLLDYYNNQFAKKAGSNLPAFLRELLPAEEIESKLNESWDYTGPISDAPTWMLREFISLWIVDALKSIQQDYKAPPVIPRVLLYEDQVFRGFETFIRRIIDACGLKVTVDQSIINETHDQFLELQKYHGSQHRCNAWLDAILHNRTRASQCRTIFDEAYIQACLREAGFEIQCDGLNTFPKTAEEIRTIITRVI